jgi:hypothetical protein
MALVVIVVAAANRADRRGGAVVVVVMASPHRRQIRHARQLCVLHRQQKHLNTSSTPSGMALIKSLFNEGAVFLAALNMGAGNSGRSEKSPEEDCHRV